MSRIRFMSNPVELMLAGNPGKKRIKTAQFTLTPKTGKSVMAKKKKSAAAKAAKVAKRHAKRTARKSGRSAAQKAATKRMLAANRASRSGSKKSAKRGKRSVAAKAKRSARKARKGRNRVRNVVTSAGATVIVRKAPRGKVRRYRKVSRFPSVTRFAVNPGFVGGITSLPANLKATWKGGIRSIAMAGLGAGGSIFAGTLLARLTTPLVMKFAPQVVRNPIGARLLGALNYYGAAYLLARFLPGIDSSTRRAILTGGAAAAVLEAIKPGVVRGTAASLPLVGPLFGDTLSGIGDDLGQYVETMLSGDEDDGDDLGRVRNAYIPENVDNANGTGAYVALADDGMGEYEQVPAFGRDGMGGV